MSSAPRDVLFAKWLSDCALDDLSGKLLLLLFAAHQQATSPCSLLPLDQLAAIGIDDVRLAASMSDDDIQLAKSELAKAGVKVMKVCCCCLLGLLALIRQ